MKRKLINILVEFYWVIEMLFIVAVILLLLHYVNVNDLEDAFWEFTNQFNPIVPAIVLFFILFIPPAVIKYLINNWYVMKLKKTLSIDVIHERIRVQEKLLKAYILDQDDGDVPKRMVKSKMMILYTLALGHINLGEYKTALNSLKRATILSVRLRTGADDLLAEGAALSVANKCLIWEAVALGALGEFDKALRRIGRFSSRMHKLNKTDRATVLLAQTEIAVQTGDIAAAREYHRKLDEEIRELAVKYNRPDLVYDSVLFDGILDKHEGKADSARKKLESVLKNTTSEGNRLRAERELSGGTGFERGEVGEERGERREESGEFRVESGGLRVESGEVRVESGGLREESGETGDEVGNSGGLVDVLPGWGPGRDLFTADAQIPQITFNSITNSHVGDERNFCNIRESGSQNLWSANVEAFPGKEYYIRIFIHNNATDNLGLIAENVRVMIHVPVVMGKIVDAHGIIESDNAVPSRIWDGVRMYSDRQFEIKYVQNSAHLINKQFPNGVSIPDSVFTKQGALVGFGQLDGRIPGGFQYAGYLFVKVVILG